MPIKSVQLTAALVWTDTLVNAGGYTSTVHGPDQTQSFGLGAIAVGTFNQIYAHQYVIASGVSVDVDLSTGLTNLVGETFGFGHVLALLVLPSAASPNGVCQIAPSPANGVIWDALFTNGVKVHPGGVYLWSDPGTGTSGTAISGAAKSIRITNSGGGNLTVNIEILGSTT